ncbi:MAG: 4-hydroxybenzoyl-CoA thioesterase [Pyrinomonadaceae bacterium]|jgi:4-hydroxybenzoyl-CoA thioesterase|nr:4-hydroxybenzoyl-CoA thioesterase [Pyrinomonadaceae bacterium]
MPFSTCITVRFGDTDPAGLVYYPNIFHYFHIGLEEFFGARCGISYRQLMADERIGFPTVKVETEFFVPLVYGDEVDVEIYVSRTGNSSATFEYALRRASDATLCARSTQVHVAMNLDTRRPVAIPEKYRLAFAASAS